MKTASEHDTRANETARKKMREELHKEISGMGLAEKIAFLKKSFKCSAGEGANSCKRDYIEGKKSFLGRERITNKCQFQPKTTLDLKHIIGYCCNDNYMSCPLYQFYACTSGLMSHRRR